MFTNSLPSVDPTEIVGQFLVSHLLGQHPPQNLLELCKFGRFASLTSYEALTVELEKHKTTAPPRFLLTAYEGDYLNATGNFILSITKRGEGLSMTVTKNPTSQISAYTIRWQHFLLVRKLERRTQAVHVANNVYCVAQGYFSVH